MEMILAGIQVDIFFGGVLRIRGDFLGVPIMWTVVMWVLYCGPFAEGNYHIWRFPKIKGLSGTLGLQWVYVLFFEELFFACKERYGCLGL